MDVSVWALQIKAMGARISYASGAPYVQRGEESSSVGRESPSRRPPPPGA
jgi:hypothetical protein